MSGTLVKRVLMQITADDADAEAKIDSIAAKADELGQKHPELKVRIDTAAAAAKMRVLREELKAASTVQADVETGDAELKVAGLAAQLEGLDTMAAHIRVKADDAQAEVTLLRLKARLAELSAKVADPKIELLGVARAEADIAALRLELDRLGKSQSSPSLRQRLFGGFGAGFKGGFGKVLAGVPGLPGGGGEGASGAGAASGAGELGIAGSASGIAAAVMGLAVVVQAALVELDGLASGFAAAGAGAGAFTLLALPAIKGVSGALTQVNADQQAYDRALTKAARSSALKHLKADYAALSPDERNAVKGIQSLTAEYDKLSKAFQPQAYKIFSDFLHLANELLPAVTPFATTFADSLHGLLGEAGKFAGSKGFTDWLAQFRKLEGPSITAIGTGLGHVAVNLGKLLTIMSAKDTVNAINIAFSALDGTIIGVAWVIRYTMRQWDEMTTAFDHGRHDTAVWFDRIRHDAASLAHGVAHSFDRIRHAVAADLGAAEHWVSGHWGLITAMVVDPVGTAAGELQRYWARIRHDIAVAWDWARHAAAAGADFVVRSAWRMAIGAEHEGERLLGWFGRLPGEVMARVDALPGMLYSSGVATVRQFVAGIESQLGAVGSAMSWVAREVWAYLPHSPAEKGPLSGAGSPDVAGKKTGLMFASGIRIAVPDVSRASARMAHAAIGGAGHPALAGAHAGAQRIELSWKGGSADAALIRLLKEHIRVTGGDPSVLGR